MTNRPAPYCFAKISDPDFGLKIEIVELLMFPLPKKQSFHFEKIDWSLFSIWQNICKLHIVDDERRYIYFNYEHAYENQEPWEDEVEEVQRGLDNALTWIETAKTEMRALCSPLYSIIADRDKYPKHYPSIRDNMETMIKKSLKDAILLPEYTIELQDFLFSKVLELMFPIILDNIDTVFIIERNKLTGFSEGKGCTKLVCKINATDCIVHFYPIHDNELFKYQKMYDNPVCTNPIFKLDEFDENTHFFDKQLDNTVEIF